jgi:hypothetical protein
MRGMMRTAGALLAALVLSACAGNRGGEGGGGGQLRLVVQNDGTIPTQVRVYLVPTGGGEVLAGSMSTLGTETLTVSAPVVQGTYYLRAEGGTGYRLNSPRIQLRPGDTVVWEMRRNLVRVR